MADNELTVEELNQHARDNSHHGPIVRYAFEMAIRAATEIPEYEKNARAAALAMARKDEQLATATAQVERMREALEFARPLVEKWCEYQGDLTDWRTQYLGPIDDALSDLPSTNTEADVDDYCGGCRQLTCRCEYVEKIKGEVLRDLIEWMSDPAFSSCSVMATIYGFSRDQGIQIKDEK